MLLSQFKDKLKTVTEVMFTKEDGAAIAKHLHITEVGQINKRFIDCGGTVRSENVVSMQLWESIDYWHRLKPNKLLEIIELSEQKLQIENCEIEIEYQGETIGKYGVVFKNNSFVLTATKTACLAMDICGVPVVEVLKEKVLLCCNPNSGCC